MTYFHLLEKFPEPLRAPLADLVDAVQKDTREQLAVRRADFEALRETVSELAQAQRRAEERLARLEIAVEELVAAQTRTDHRVRTLTDKVSKLEGIALESSYRDKVTGYFSTVLRKARVTPLSAIEDTLEARLSPDQAKDVLRLDLLVTGRVRETPPGFVGQEIWLAVEVSATIDGDDVTRARRRAGALRQAGYPCVPVVAGTSLTDAAADQIETLSVAVLTDGQMAHWERTLQTWNAIGASDSAPA